jgi:hypothetical protein
MAGVILAVTVICQNTSAIVRDVLLTVPPEFGSLSMAPGGDSLGAHTGACCCRRQFWHYGGDYPRFQAHFQGKLWQWPW